MNNSKASLTRKLAAAAVTGAAYAVLTVSLAPISYGALQFRVSEVLCILPYFMPCTAWGLFAGCILANLMTANIFDIVFGSLATLFAALCTAAIGKRRHTLGNDALACLMPVVFNAVIVGAVIVGAYEGLHVFEHFDVYLLTAASVGFGELVVLFLLGLPLMRLLPGKKFFREFTEKTNA
ncbi:MAG: QueT transporter family protein [Oscillospiraceae bacterium]|nr:QueT transporter family protein [Oscillospiraceae bacterium]